SRKKHRMIEQAVPYQAIHCFVTSAAPAPTAAAIIFPLVCSAARQRAGEEVTLDPTPAIERGEFLRGLPLQFAFASSRPIELDPHQAVFPVRTVRFPVHLNRMVERGDFGLRVTNFAAVVHRGSPQSSNSSARAASARATAPAVSNSRSAASTIARISMPS